MAKWSVPAEHRLSKNACSASCTTYHSVGGPTARGLLQGQAVVELLLRERKRRCVSRVVETRVLLEKPSQPATQAGG